MKIDLILQISLFHPDMRLRKGCESDERIAYFEDYLSSESLSKEETIQRVFIIRGMIDCALEGRRKDEEWENAREQKAKLSEKIKKETGITSTIYDEYLRGHHQRKEKWLKWAYEWDYLLTSNLSRQKLLHWFIIESGRK